VHPHQAAGGYHAPAYAPDVTLFDRVNEHYAAAGQERSTLRRIESDPERVAACPRNAARKLDQVRKMPAIGSHEEECHRAMSVNV
jgi:hypothetical protein